MAEGVEKYLELTNQLVIELMTFCMKQREEVKGHDGMVGKLQIAALMQVLATIAVDEGSNVDNFLAMSRAVFEGAYTKAPKWG